MTVEGMQALLRAADHLENCIDAIRRAARFLHLKAFDELTGKLDWSAMHALLDEPKRLRDAIQHAEERLRDGEGEPFFIAVSSDGVRFAGEALFYSDLLLYGSMLHDLVWGFVEPPLKEMLVESA